MHHLNQQTSAKPAITKSQMLSIKLVDTEIFQIEPKLSFV